MVHSTVEACTNGFLSALLRAVGPSPIAQAGPIPDSRVRATVAFKF